MGIDRSDIEMVAGLARLDLEAGELERLTRDCAAILEFFEKVSELDAESPVTAASSQPTPQRDDGVEPDALTAELSQLAPAWREGFFVLPRLAALDGEALDDDG